MRSTQLTRGDRDDRMRQLAGEVALRAIEDLRLLRRRGAVKGMKVIPCYTGRDLNECPEYNNTIEIRKLLRDFKNGTITWWCRAGGINIDTPRLLRMMEV